MASAREKNEEEEGKDEKRKKRKGRATRRPAHQGGGEAQTREVSSLLLLLERALPYFRFTVFVLVSTSLFYFFLFSRAFSILFSWRGDRSLESEFSKVSFSFSIVWSFCWSTRLPVATSSIHCARVYTSCSSVSHTRLPVFHSDGYQRKRNSEQVEKLHTAFP